jgi:hypothetical protein
LANHLRPTPRGGVLVQFLETEAMSKNIRALGFELKTLKEKSKNLEVPLETLKKVLKNQNIRCKGHPDLSKTSHCPFSL